MSAGGSAERVGRHGGSVRMTKQHGEPHAGPDGLTATAGGAESEERDSGQRSRVEGRYAGRSQHRRRIGVDPPIRHDVQPEQHVALDALLPRRPRVHEGWRVILQHRDFVGTQGAGNERLGSLPRRLAHARCAASAQQAAQAQPKQPARRTAARRQTDRGTGNLSGVHRVQCTTRHRSRSLGPLDSPPRHPRRALLRCRRPRGRMASLAAP